MSKSKKASQSKQRHRPGKRKTLHSQDVPTGQELVDIRDIQALDKDAKTMDYQHDDIERAMDSAQQRLLAGLLRQGVNRGPGSFDTTTMSIKRKAR